MTCNNVFDVAANERFKAKEISDIATNGSITLMHAAINKGMECLHLCYFVFQIGQQDKFSYKVGVLMILLFYNYAVNMGE